MHQEFDLSSGYSKGPWHWLHMMRQDHTKQKREEGKGKKWAKWSSFYTQQHKIKRKTQNSCFMTELNDWIELRVQNTSHGGKQHICNTKHGFNWVRNFRTQLKPCRVHASCSSLIAGSDTLLFPTCTIYWPWDAVSCTPSAYKSLNTCHGYGFANPPHLIHFTSRRVQNTSRHKVVSSIMVVTHTVWWGRHNGVCYRLNNTSHGKRGYSLFYTQQQHLKQKRIAQK